MFEWALWFMSWGDWLLGPKLWWALAAGVFLLLGQVPFISRSLSLALAIGVLSLGYQSHAYNLGWYGAQAAIEKRIGKNIKGVRPPEFKSEAQRQVEDAVKKTRKTGRKDKLRP